MFLSVLDHFVRRKSDQTSVIGTLLGHVKSNGEIVVSNSFAIPYNRDRVCFFTRESCPNKK